MIRFQYIYFPSPPPHNVFLITIATISISASPILFLSYLCFWCIKISCCCFIILIYPPYSPMFPLFQYLHQKIHTNYTTASYIVLQNLLFWCFICAASIITVVHDSFINYINFPTPPPLLLYLYCHFYLHITLTYSTLSITCLPPQFPHPCSVDISVVSVMLYHYVLYPLSPPPYTLSLC